MIFMGIKGRELARESRTFSNHEQYLGFMKAVDHVGKVIALFYLVALIIGAIISGAILTSFDDDAHDGTREYQYGVDPRILQ